MTTTNEVCSAKISEEELKSANWFKNEYLTFPQAAERYPAFTEGALRWYRFHNINGFNCCVRQIGRKCVISLHDFLNWLEGQKGK